MAIILAHIENYSDLSGCSSIFGGYSKDIAGSIRILRCLCKSVELILKCNVCPDRVSAIKALASNIANDTVWVVCQVSWFGVALWEKRDLRVNKAIVRSDTVQPEDDLKLILQEVKKMVRQFEWLEEKTGFVVRILGSETCLKLRFWTCWKTPKATCCQKVAECLHSG